MKLQKYPSIALRALETFGGRAQMSVFLCFLQLLGMRLWITD